MTLEIYQKETFGDLNVSEVTAIDEYLPSTHTFTESNTFKKSNAFKKSNTFTASLPRGAVFTNTLTLTHLLSLTQTMSIYSSTLSLSFSVFFSGSASTYVQTEVIYYAYTYVA